MIESTDSFKSLTEANFKTLLARIQKLLSGNYLEHFWDPDLARTSDTGLELESELQQMLAKVTMGQRIIQCVRAKPGTDEFSSVFLVRRLNENMSASSGCVLKVPDEPSVIAIERAADDCLAAADYASLEVILSST